MYVMKIPDWDKKGTKVEGTVVRMASVITNYIQPRITWEERLNEGFLDQVGLWCARKWAAAFPGLEALKCVEKCVLRSEHTCIQCSLLLIGVCYD